MNCDTCRNSGTIPAPNGFEPCPDCNSAVDKVTRKVRGVECFYNGFGMPSKNIGVLLDQPLPKGFEPVVARPDGTVVLANGKAAILSPATGPFWRAEF
jgi:hypothetical protein